MAQSDKPRLFKKTVRVCDPAAGTTSLGKRGEQYSLANLGIHPSLAKFAFSSKVKGRIKREGEGTSGTRDKGGARDVIGGGKGGGGMVKKTGFSTPLRCLRSRTTLKFSLNPSLPTSCTHSLPPSHSPSPRSSFLTIDAINLELRLTGLLSDSETLSSPQRHRAAFKACLEVLGEVADRDTEFGLALQTIKGEVERFLVDSRAKEVNELEERNADLKRYIKEQKQLIKDEGEQKSCQERLIESLGREKNLLGKKMEELQTHMRRNAGRQGWEEGDAKTRKVEELEDQLKVARKRESRLLRLLEVLKASQDSDRSDESYGGSVVPPLDLLLVKRDPAGRMLSKAEHSSERSTEDLKSSLSLELSDAPSCNH